MDSLITAAARAGVHGDHRGATLIFEASKYGAKTEGASRQRR